MLIVISFEYPSKLMAKDSLFAKIKIEYIPVPEGKIF